MKNITTILRWIAFLIILIFGALLSITLANLFIPWIDEGGFIPFPDVFKQVGYSFLAFTSLGATYVVRQRITASIITCSYIVFEIVQYIWRFGFEWNVFVISFIIALIFNLFYLIARIKGQEE